MKRWTISSAAPIVLGFMIDYITAVMSKHMN
jgi:hypothetical protein